MDITNAQNAKVIAEYFLDYFKQYGREKTIREIINQYAKLYPDEFIKALNHKKIIEGNQANDFGSTKDNELRFGVMLPSRLFTVLDRFLPPNEPKFLRTTGELRWFMVNFPEWCVAKKV